MKIQVINDLHIEFDQGPGQLTLPGGEVLLLPGDVCVAAYLRPNRTDKLAKRHAKVCKQFFFEECAKYQKVYYIMGNHEHYNGIFNDTPDVLREFLAGTNVTLLDKEFVNLNDEWRLFGGTLWTDYNNQDWFAMHAAKDKMNDHTIIKMIKPVANPYGEMFGRFLPLDAYVEHNKTLEAFANGIYEWKDIDKKVIVMTHHAPTHQSIMPQYAGDLLNAAYASNLSELIMDHPTIKYWFHGHMHDSIDYMVGECQVKCNPRGYVGYALNPNFNLDFEFEV